MVTTVDAADVLLACEVTSPGNAANDRVIKRELYAEAGIAWYLLVKPDMTDYESVSLHLYRLDGASYVEHAKANPGETLVSDLPFPIAIRTTDLVDP